MRIGFLGLGLIGGSMARALRESLDFGSATLVGWSPSGRGPAAARAVGVLDEVASAPDDLAAAVDMVVLAAPPLACLALLDSLAGWLPTGPGASGPLVTDVASTKTAIVRRAAELGLRFVGGHPMAGRERSGFEAADGELFEGRPWIVVPPDRAHGVEDLERVEALARACQARPVRMTAEDHDAAVAAISHLPLIVAAALVEAVAGADDGSGRPDWPAARSLAASGWRDMTRLARGDVEMGVGIAATNVDAILDRLHDLQAILAAWIVELERPGGPDEAALARRLAAARARLEAGEPGA